MKSAKVILLPDAKYKWNSKVVVSILTTYVDNGDPHYSDLVS